MGGLFDRVVGERPQVRPNNRRFSLNKRLIRVNRDGRHVALKVLSSYASREVEAGRLGERDILRKITTASPLHRGFEHVVHLSHEFTFESYVGQHICFVMDVLSYSVPSLQSQLADPRLPLRFILRLTKHVLKGLEYLHDECKVIHSGVSCLPFAVGIGQAHNPTDLKPGNILLLPSEIDEVVKQDLAEQPSTLYGFPKTIPPNELPFHPVMSAPLVFNPNVVQGAGLHWVIADLGHGALTWRLLWVNYQGLTFFSPSPTRTPERYRTALRSART